MATIRKELWTSRRPDAVWDALADIGALHTRLVPGFVVDTQLEPGARVVTFGNGMVVREPIVSVDPVLRRVVWTAEVETFRHYNGAAEVVPDGNGSRVTWTADVLPDDAAPMVRAMMEQGMAAMKQALDGDEPPSIT